MVLALAAGACSRGAVQFRGPGDGGELGDAQSAADAADAASDAPTSLAPDGRVADGSPIGLDAVAVDSGCVPSVETCNGLDDDCDGQTDELPPEPCANGGSSFCVAGRMSACPRRCDTCLPGSERTCYLSYCTYWAVQRCAADGRSFGRCREQGVPAECEEAARRWGDSRQLEQCCIDNGYCCRDDYDLDGDGDRSESVGACGDVACEG